MKSDPDLQNHVMLELAWDARIDATAIGVSVHHGIVTLNGVVGSWAEKHAVEEAAHRVAGVLDVANDIAISLSWSPSLGDADVAAAVRHALEWDVFVPHQRIQSTVSDNGSVRLSGAVNTLQQRDDAERAVRNLKGVRTVTNEIAIAPSTVAPDEVREMIESALRRHVAREAQAIAVSVQGDTVSLTGTVGSWGERRAAIGAAKGTPGVRRVDDQLRIQP